MTKKYFNKRIKEMKDNDLFDGCCPFRNGSIECNILKYETCRYCQYNEEYNEEYNEKYNK